MIRTEIEPGRFPEPTPSYVVHYKTPKREGSKRFGGHAGREFATIFAVELLRELLN
jgi:hypothetical protein